MRLDSWHYPQNIFIFCCLNIILLLAVFVWYQIKETYTLLNKMILNQLRLAYWILANLLAGFS